jgi:hypothetical protein
MQISFKVPKIAVVYVLNSTGSYSAGDRMVFGVQFTQAVMVRVRITVMLDLS